MKIKHILLSLALIAPMVFSCKKNNFAEAWQVDNLKEQMAVLNDSIQKLSIAAQNVRQKIAAVDGKLDQAATAIRGDMQKEFEDVCDTLDRLKQMDTTLMKQIAKLEADVNEMLEPFNAMATDITDLKTRVGTLETSLNLLSIAVTGIQTQIQSLLERVTELETQYARIIAQIQSAVIIPDFSDGSVACNSGSNRFHFEVKPSGTAALLTQVPLTSFSMKAIYTATKALSFVSMPVSAVEADGDILTVTASGANLNTSFLAHQTPANASLSINEGATDYSTSYFSLTPIIESNLAAGGTANCYVVPASGTWSFPTVKGNSTSTVGTVTSADVLWESFGTATAPTEGDVVTNVRVEGSKIVFDTPWPLNNGNAVIAAKSASGTILWSWHIWVCGGYNPEATAQIYYNNAGTMMDRNLGATSAIPGDVRSLGLMYQWGRKDPFLGSSSISSNTKAASTLAWPTPVESTSSNGTIVYTVKNPTTFITQNTNNNDWCYSTTSTTDNSRWSSTKTIYDPCPLGWRVPDGGASGVWAMAIGGTDAITHTWNSKYKGMNVAGNFGPSNVIWYPAAGYLYEDDGSIRSVGSSGQWWSCSFEDYPAYRLNLGSAGNISPFARHFRASGHSVRCIQ